MHLKVTAPPPERGILPSVIGEKYEKRKRKRGKGKKRKKEEI
jgi:hypothetical protein